MKIIYSLTLVLCLCCLQIVNAAVTLPVFPSATFNVTSYGASSSTTADNTVGIQKAIDACTAAGGGVVVIPSGTFLSGPLTMKNNVNLQISSGATLRLLPYGSGNGTVAGTYPNSGTTNDYTDFIYGKNVKNIAISGTGTIDGQGSDWWTAYKANTAISRPCLVRFDACSTIAITGITLINAPNVHITIGQKSNNSTLANLTINSPSTSPNTDGVDTWSPNINIFNCNITCGDDNIAMDSESQNITVKHCTFGTGHGCSVGSYTTNVSNILVDSCTFNGTTAGMRLKTARGRGGIESNITYSNITMTGVTTPIFIASYYPKLPTSATADTAQAITSTTPQWQNITLKNAVITGSPTAGTIWGLPEQSIVNITFDNVQVSATKGMVINYATGVVFKNCSSITTTSGNAIISTYKATVSGIDFTTGVSTSCTAPATLTKQGAGSSNQTITIGSSIVNFAYVWANATTVAVTGLPTGVSAAINTSTKTVTISGTPTVTGVFKFAVSTVGGSPDSTRGGSITVNNVVTDVNVENLASQHLIYPNPFTNHFTIQQKGLFDYQLFDNKGALLLDGKAENETQIGDSLPKGLYVLKIKNEGSVSVCKVVKE